MTFNDLGFFTESDSDGREFCVRCTLALLACNNTEKVPDTAGGAEFGGWSHAGGQKSLTLSMDK